MPVALDHDATHHLRVLRVVAGASIGLTDGAGTLAAGHLVRLGKSEAIVEVDETWTVAAPPPIHLLVPVADRERVLWLAEKCAELQVATWRPVHWRRSTSVAPRGSGDAFRARVVARMVSALTQSGGAWLPDVREERSLDDALLEIPAGTQIALDRDGVPLLHLAAGRWAGPVVLALGPEGGLEAAEHERLAAAGFARGSVGDTILRFETAGVAALAVVRAAYAAADGSRAATGSRSASDGH